jgi:hypothetical protein
VNVRVSFHKLEYWKMSNVAKLMIVCDSPLYTKVTLTKKRNIKLMMMVTRNCTFGTTA